MKLSPDVRRVWRRFSFQAMGWGLGFLGWWATDTAPDLKAKIGTTGALAILAFLLVAGMIGSCLDQPSTKVPKDPQ